MRTDLRCETKDGLIHACVGDRIIPHDHATFIVWSLCGFDVQANGSFKSNEAVTCHKCSPDPAKSEQS